MNQENETLKIPKLLGSKTRLAILNLIVKSGGKLCVNDISKIIKQSHSATSHQLGKLEKAGVLSSRRNGQNVCYIMNDTKESRDLKKIIGIIKN